MSTRNVIFNNDGCLVSNVEIKCITPKSVIVNWKSLISKQTTSEYFIEAYCDDIHSNNDNVIQLNTKQIEYQCLINGLNSDNNYALNFDLHEIVEHSDNCINNVIINFKTMSNTYFIVCYYCRIFGGLLVYNKIDDSIFNIIEIMAKLDKWDLNCCADDIEIDENTLIVQCDTYVTPSSAFLLNTIKSGIYSWKFEIYYWSWDLRYFQIGINSTKQNTIYSLNITKALLVDAAYCESDMKYGKICDSGDIIEMIINFNNMTLSYIINDINYGIAHCIKRAEYRAVIHLVTEKHHEGAVTCLELIE